MKIHVLSIDMLELQKEQHRKSNEVQGKRQKNINAEISGKSV